MFTVIDNFLKIENFYFMKKIITGDNFPWFFNNQKTYNTNDKNLFNFQFTHTFYKEYTPKSDFFYILEIYFSY